jgi:hypothetical protein
MFTFDLRPDGGDEVRVTATSRDISRWERLGKDRSLSRLEDNARMSDLEEIAHLAAQRHGHFAGTIADFREQVDVVPVAPDQVEEAGPTQSGR